MDGIAAAGWITFMLPDRLQGIGIIKLRTIK